MIGHSARRSAGRRDQEHIGVAIVLTSEKDLRSVGREARDAPQVAGIREDDRRFAESWFLKEVIRRKTGGQSDAEQQYDTKHTV